MLSLIERLIGCDSSYAASLSAQAGIEGHRGVHLTQSKKKFFYIHLMQQNKKKNGKKSFSHVTVVEIVTRAKWKNHLAKKNHLANHLELVIAHSCIF